MKEMIETNHDLKENVYKFYERHMKECHEQYQLAIKNMRNIYENMDNEEFENYLPKISIIVLTANKFEKNILHSHIYFRKGKKQKIKQIRINLYPGHSDKNCYVYAYIFKWNCYMVLHISANKTGSHTFGGSADILRYLFSLQLLMPRAIISLGICFGCDEHKYELGDTIISEKIYPYFVGSKITDRKLMVDDENGFVLEPELRATIKNNILDCNVLENLGFKTDLGNYITGEAVVSDRVIRDIFTEITTQHIDAGEMEGYGIFKECFNYNLNIPCVIIKSICDWGAEKNILDKKMFKEYISRDPEDNELEKIKDYLQALAAYHAYQVTDVIMKNRVFNISIFDIAKTEVLEYDENIIYLKRIKQKIGKYIKNEQVEQTIKKIIHLLVKENILIPIKINDKELCNNAWKILKEE